MGSARLMAGDALAVADRLLQEGLAGQFDLVHLDPPFGSEADYLRRRSLSLNGARHQLELAAYGDTDGGDLAGYLEGLYPLLCRYHELLADHGSLYLHIDFRRGPYLRLMLDEIFGAENLVNEIVWAYALGGSSRRRYQRKHDLIYFYARSVRQMYFMPPKEAATSSMLAGQPKKATDTWISADREDGTPIDRDWPDELVRKTLSNRDPERTGYPTQKPLALATRMVRASAPAGGRVLDLMAGSGTVGLAAALLGHEAVLGDCADPALDVIRGRLLSAGAALNLEGVDGEGAWQTWPGGAPCTIEQRSDGGAAAQLRAAPLPWSERALRAPPATRAALAKQSVEDGTELLGAWGVAIDAPASARVLASWDCGAQRDREPLCRRLEWPTGGEGQLWWWAVDVLGRRWRAPIG